MSPFIIAMAIFVLGWRLRAVERGRAPVYRGGGGGDNVGAALFFGLVFVAIAMALRYYGITDGNRW